MSLLDGPSPPTYSAILKEYFRGLARAIFTFFEMTLSFNPRDYADCLLKISARMKVYRSMVLISRFVKSTGCSAVVLSIGLWGSGLYRTLSDAGAGHFEPAVLAVLSIVEASVAMTVTGLILSLLIWLVCKFETWNAVGYVLLFAICAGPALGGILDILVTLFINPSYDAGYSFHILYGVYSMFLSGYLTEGLSKVQLI
jgi:hypothetical protein